MGNFSCHGVGKRWNELQKIELRRLHLSSSSSFEPDENDKDLQLLRFIWMAMSPSRSFERKSERWKSMGWQGVDPKTDVRGGGRLAVECYEHFVTFYTAGAELILREIKAMEIKNSERFYPLCTTAVVICTHVAQLIGFSKKNLGPLSLAALEKYLVAPKPIPLGNSLLNNDKGLSFTEMFSHVLCHFHIIFRENEKYTYMDSHKVLERAMNFLKNSLTHCQNVDSMREYYASKEPKMKEFLRAGGGAAKGWRHARTAVRSQIHEGLSTEAGVVYALKGKSLLMTGLHSNEHRDSRSARQHLDGDHIFSPPPIRRSFSGCGATPPPLIPFGLGNLKPPPAPPPIDALGPNSHLSARLSLQKMKSIVAKPALRRHSSAETKYQKFKQMKKNL